MTTCRYRTGILLHILIASLVAAPAVAWAQTQPTVPVSPKLPPGIAFSGAIGSVTATDYDFYGGPTRERSALVSASLEVALNRFMLAQGELLTWGRRNSGVSPGHVVKGLNTTGYSGDLTYQSRGRETALMGNFLGRVGERRYFGMVGFGVGVSRDTYRDTTHIVGCVPWAAGACSTTEYQFAGASLTMAIQFLAGMDVVLTPRLTTFANVRQFVGDDSMTTVTAGMRWTARRAPVSPGWHGPANPAAARSAIGKGVHVEAYDHSRRNGTLVSLTDTHVTIRSMTGEATIPLTEVRGIRRQTHAILGSTLVGFGGGFATGLLLCASDGCGDDGVPAFGVGLLFGGIGAGAGAAIGAIYNLTTADARIVYVGHRKSAIAIAPIVGKRRAGVGGSIRW